VKKQLYYNSTLFLQYTKLCTIIMPCNEVDTRIYSPKNIIFTEVIGRGKYNILWLMTGIHRLIVLLYDTFLYVTLTLK